MMICGCKHYHHESTNMKKFGLLFMIMWFLMHFKLLNYVIENEINGANVLKVLNTYIHHIHSKLLHMFHNILGILSC
jgi:hypothetical protein